MSMKMYPKRSLNKSCQLHKIAIVLAVGLVMVGCGKDPLPAGKAYMEKGEYSSAVIEFKNAVQAKPDSFEARLALAGALERIYDTLGAEQHLRKALSAGGDAAALLPRIALMMLDRNELAKIINEFKDRRLNSPEADSDLRAVVAVAYLGQKQTALADDQLKGATAKTAAIMLATAQSLLAQGKKEQALAVLDGSLAQSSAPWWVLRGLARVHEASGNRDQAFQFITRAYQTAPWHWGVMGEYAEFLLGMGRLDPAIAVRDRLKKLAPSFYMTNYVDALILSQQGRPEESMAAALRAAAGAPEHLPTILMIASAELQKGDVMMAERRLRKIIPQYPFSVPALELLAQAQLRLGQTAGATEAISRGLGVAPDNAQLLSLRAESEVMRGATKEAIATLEKLNSKDPGNASYLLRLSELMAGAGNKDAARNFLGRAAEAGKDNPAVRDRVIAIALGTGEIKLVRQLADHAMKTQPQDPQSHLTLAATLAVEHDQPGAWRETLAALDLKPAFQPALTALAMMARDPSQRAELITRYKKAVQSKPTDAQTYLDYAALLRTTEKSADGTVALLETGVRSLPNSAMLRAALVQEHMRAGKADAALSVAQAGASSNNASADELALLATVYEQIGNAQMATETYRKLAADYPQRSDSRIRLAELEANAGRKKEATTILRSMIGDRPYDPSPYIALARLTWTDNLAEALSIARSLGEKDPNKLTAMLLEGDLLALAGKTDEALKQYTRAAKAGAVPAALLRGVETLARAGRRQAAEQEVADALRQFPDDPTVIGFAAQRVRSQGNPTKAAKMLQTIADKNPGNPALLNDLAWAQVEAKLPDALKNATRAAELAPNSPEVLDTLGMAQALAGKSVDAIMTLRTAVNLAPQVATHRLHLADLYVASGDRKEAANLIRSLDHKKLDSRDQETLARLTKSVGS